MLNVYALTVAEELMNPKAADAVGYSEWTQARGMIVLASSESEARRIAAADDFHGGIWWTSPSHTKCELQNLSGQPRILMMNVPTG